MKFSGKMWLMIILIPFWENHRCGGQINPVYALLVLLLYAFKPPIC